MIEVEVKYRIEDADAFEQRLLQCDGTVSVSEVQQCDQYFLHPVRNFDATDEALRIRSIHTPGQPDAMQLCYKGPRLDALTKTREEIECDLVPEDGSVSPHPMHSILNALSFLPAGVVRKHRRSYECRSGERTLTVSIDRLAELGAFVEIEIVCQEPDRRTATDVVLQFAASLGLSRSERRSYLELLAEPGATET